MAIHDENEPQQQLGSSLGRRQRLDNALELGPRKKAYPFLLHLFTITSSLNSASCLTDPLVHHGRHFGRTVHALCRVHAVLNNGILRESSILGDVEQLATEQ
jgi:hypothetical protein